MNVLIAWWDWTGYMDACAKELQRLLSCNLDIVCLEGGDKNAPFSETQFFLYPCKSYTLNGEALDTLRKKDYDLILFCGWSVDAYRELARINKRRAVRILCMDNQWKGSLRQYLGVAVFRAHLRSLYDAAFVPGGRQARFASYMGFASDEIIEGHYACADTFAQQAEAQSAPSFLFVGRLVPEKGLNELAAAWRAYTERNKDPWRLKICGTGPLSGVFAELPNTELMGFIQPSQLPGVMASSSALVLPSLQEPWGVVVMEATRSGLGLLLTTVCGAADYFLRDRLNGRLVPPGDVNALCEALEWFHELDAASLERVRQKSVMLSTQRTPLTWACAVSRALSLGPSRLAQSKTKRRLRGFRSSAGSRRALYKGPAT